MTDDKMAQFKADRQRKLAKYVGQQFHNCDNLVPKGPHGSFGLSPMEHSGYWTDERAIDIAWWAVATQLNGLFNRYIIDHAWLITYENTSTESWALVTEPYLDEVQG